MDPQEINKIKYKDSPEEYRKQYYAVNKNKYKAFVQKQNETKIECPSCKCTVIKRHFKKHIITKKHLKNIEA